MPKPKEGRYEDYDELEFSHGPDFEIELFEDTPFDDITESDGNLAAWRRIERHTDDEWLRDQLADWDDWVAH